MRRNVDPEIYIKNSPPLAEAAHENVLGGTYAPARAIALRGFVRTAQALSARPLGAPSVGTALRLKPRGL